MEKNPCKTLQLRNLILASALGCLSVLLGAFGAHALKELLSAEALESYETGVRYMMMHVLVILFLNVVPGLERRTINLLSKVFFAGIFLFSGSIFAISTGLIEARSIWFVTPLGGLLLVIGWLGMAVAFFKKANEEKPWK